MIRPDEERAARRVLRDAAKARKDARPRNEGVRLAGEPAAGTKRKRLTRAQRESLFLDQDGACAKCHEPIYLDRPMIDEHILPLELGGSNDLGNRALYCVPCAKAKTKIDIGRIAKAKRQAKLLQPRVPSKRPLRSRGFG